MRNVFVSYSHRLDQDVVDEFRRKFGNDKMVFSDCSLENKDLSHLSDDTIKNNYIRPQLRLSSVTIVLIGAETGGRWWVDWEIYFSLRKSAGNERNGMDCSYCLDFFWVYVAYIFVVQKRKNIYAYIIKKQIILRKIIR